MIIFRCSCGKQLQVNDDRAGSKVKCPECEEILRVPEGGSIREKSGPPPKTRPSPMEQDDADFAEEGRRPRRRSARADEQDDDRTRRRLVPYDDHDDNLKPRRRRQASGGHGLLIGLIVGGVLLLIGVAVGLFLLLGSHLGASPRDKSILSKNMKQLTLAMHSFNDRYKRLPCPGFSTDPGQVKPKMAKPSLSWRVAILPFIGEDNLYGQFNLDESWDGPNNIKLLEKMPMVFQPVGPQKAERGHTFLQFVTGPGTLYPTPISVASIPRSFPDGTSATVVILEAAEAAPWTKPADFTIDVTNVEQGMVPKLGALVPDGFYAGHGDGSVWFYSRNQVSDRTIRQAFNPADGMAAGPDWENIKFAP
jgi:hypothetical protein